MKTEDITDTSMKALEEQVQKVVNFDKTDKAKSQVTNDNKPAGSQSTANNDTEISMETVAETDKRSNDTDELENLKFNSNPATKVLLDGLQEEIDDKISQEENAVESVASSNEDTSDDTDKKKNNDKARKIAAIVSYGLCLVAYGISGWLAYTTYSNKMPFVQGILTFLPVWITTYWFSTFFAQLIEVKKKDGSLRYLLDKRTRKFMNNFLYILGLVFIAIWIYLYITQYMLSANNNNVQLTL